MRTVNKIDQAWQLFQDLQRQYPCWPSTFSTCDCGRGSGRGGGPCAYCIEENLAELVGPELSKRASLALSEVACAWCAICESLEQGVLLNKFESAPTQHRWRVSGCGETQGLYYISVWRYGVAAEGDPSIVQGAEWFTDPHEHACRLRHLGVLVED